MNEKLLATVGLLILLGAGIAGTGCVKSDPVEASTGEAVAQADDEKDTAADEAAAEEEAIPVEVTTLATGEIASVLRFSANLEAENEVQVFSEAKRLVRELFVEEGNRVRRGQVLLRLEDKEQRSAIAKVRSQLSKAEREYKRQKQLHEQELISQQLFAEAIFELEQRQLSLQDAERELTYTEVRAPISGTVTSRLVKVGDQVQIGQHLFDLVDFDSIVARIFVPEKHLAELSRGLRANVSPAAAEGREYVATVDRIAPIVDPQSGTIKVTVAVGGQEGLRPGMYVNVDLVTATSDDAVLVPKRALVYDSDQMFVYRLSDDLRVEQVFIEPRLTDKHHVEPADGLLAGDLVVVAGQAGLKDGALVRLPAEETAEGDDLEASETTEKASL